MDFEVLFFLNKYGKFYFGVWVYCYLMRSESKFVERNDLCLLSMIM